MEWPGLGREGRMLLTTSVRRRRGNVAQISCEDQGWMVVREQACTWSGIHNRDNDLVHRRWSGVGGVIGREGTMVLWSCQGTGVTGAERG
jgi:hypothetical protein